MLIQFAMFPVGSESASAEVSKVIDLIDKRPPDVELILTGRYVDNRIIEMADLVTEMVKVKHPFDKGIKARKGIEY